MIITAKGQPDLATRLFLKRVKSTLNIPILGLFDSDPYGLRYVRAVPDPRTWTIYTCLLGTTALNDKEF